MMDQKNMELKARLSSACSQGPFCCGWEEAPAKTQSKTAAPAWKEEQR